jgi:uncharacterized protein YjbI with pentapeptide repeats
MRAKSKLAVIFSGLCLVFAVGCGGAEDGKTGATGPEGPGGAAGDPGDPGDPGSQGPTGPIGPGGPQGQPGADGADGAEGHTVVFVDEEAGDNCEHGGQKIIVGTEFDDEGNLDEEAESTNVHYLCEAAAGDQGEKGDDGRTPTIRQTPIDEGDELCIAGGTLVEFGFLDADDEFELEQAFSVCDSSINIEGDGAGLEATVAPIPAGGDCEGNRVTLRFDGEILDLFDVCTGEQGIQGCSVVLEHTAAEAGFCPEGVAGRTVTTSYSGTDCATAPSTFTVCDGATGEQGLQGCPSRLTQTPFTGEQGSCMEGGTNFTLIRFAGEGCANDDDTETFRVCAGATGAPGSPGGQGVQGEPGEQGEQGEQGCSSELSRAAIAANPESLTCPTGGTRVTITNVSGEDCDDRSDTTFDVCTGATGAPGADGCSTTLTQSTFNGALHGCTVGGSTLVSTSHSGVDCTPETPVTTHICNGATGATGAQGCPSTITQTTFSGNENGCREGGTTIVSTSFSGATCTADPNPVTTYVCNGATGCGETLARRDLTPTDVDSNGDVRCIYGGTEVRIIGYSTPLTGALCSVENERERFDICYPPSEVCQLVPFGNCQGVNFSTNPNFDLLKDEDGVVILEDYDLRYIDLSGAHLANAVIRNVRLEGARLNGANLTEAEINNTNFDGADFTNAILAAATSFVQSGSLANTTWGSTICPDQSNSNNNGYNGFSCRDAALQTCQLRVEGICSDFDPYTGPTNLSGRNLAGMDFGRTIFPANMNFSNAILTGLTSGRRASPTPTSMGLP